MKITTLSDIHYPYNNRQLEESLKSMLDSDIIVIAGDISHNLIEYEYVLKRFKELSSRKLAVLGNHDLYTEDRSDSYKKIKILQNVCKRNGFHLLDSEPVVIDRVGFVGNIGWYDYKFAQIKDNNEEVLVVPKDRRKVSRLVRINDLDDLDFSEKAFRFHDSRTVSWNDRKYINWKFSDKEFLELQLKKLAEHLERVENRCDNIVYVSHHVPIWNFIYQKPNDSEWGVFNAYQGSPELGDLAFSNPKLKIVICGHSHIHNQAVVNGVNCYDVSNRFGKLKPIHLFV